MAALAYSKYHGALVVLLTVLSNLRLLRNPKFYAACVVTLLLILFGGLSLWIYIILWLIVPKAPKRLNA